MYIYTLNILFVSRLQCYIVRNISYVCVWVLSKAETQQAGCVPVPVLFHDCRHSALFLCFFFLMRRLCFFFLMQRLYEVYALQDFLSTYKLHLERTRTNNKLYKIFEFRSRHIYNLCIRKYFLGCNINNITGYLVCNICTHYDA